MLNFRPIAMEDYTVYQQLTQGILPPLCEYCFTDQFIWHDHYDSKICFAGDLFFARSEYEGHYSYTVPIGTGDAHWGMEQLRQDAARMGVPLRLHAISQDCKAWLEREFPDEFTFTQDVDGSDYIYEAEKLMTLKGKKLQSKRNFINRFQKEYEGRWEYQELTAENRDEVYAFHLHWVEQNRACPRGNEYQGETCAVCMALHNWDALGLEGGALRLDGKMIAFTVGTRYRPDLYVMQFEKADSDIQGAYQMINQQFAIRHFGEVDYVNREEDMGLEGLRKAKQSYYPTELGTEYCAIGKDV